MAKLKKIIWEDLNEIIFCLYLFLPLFLLPVVILSDLKIYKIFFIIINVILLILSTYKSRRIITKRDAIILSIIGTVFLIDYFFRRNIYTLSTYIDIFKISFIPCYYYNRVNDIKKVLSYLSIFSKLLMITFIFDPFFHYFYTDNYMGYGYALMLPTVLSIYLNHFVNKKEGDLLYILIGIAGIFVFSNRNCILTIVTAIILSFSFLKKEFVCFRLNFKKGLKPNYNNIIKKNILIIILLLVSFTCNYHIVKKSMISDFEFNNFIKIKDKMEESDSKTSKTNDISDNQLVDNNSINLDINSYSIEKYKQFLSGNFKTLLSGRIEIYAKAIDVINNNVLAKPLSALFGLGTGYFRSINNGIYSHNIIFDLIIEYGFTGMATILLLLIYCIIKFIKSHNDNKIIFLFGIYCLCLFFPKLLLSSYFQKEPTFLLFMLVFISMYPINFDKKNNKNKDNKENKEMKKLLFLSAANSIHTVKWVNALSKKYEVHLVYCANHAPTIHKIDDNVILHKLKKDAKIGYYTNVFQMKKLYREIKPDIINVHYASGYGTLARLAKLPDITLNVWGSDVYDFPNESKIKRYILKKNLLYAKKIASTSNVMAKEVYRQFPKLKTKIYVTPFGVDTKKFKSNRSNRIRKQDVFVIGNIKALKPKYGIKYIILGIDDFIKRLKEQHQYKNNIKCYIYGDGEQKEELEELIKKLKLNKVIKLKGRIPNDKVPEALNEFDVFCAASVINSESFGVAIVEAMSCEVPVIATKIDGFSEVMVDQETGILIEKENYKDISKALEEMYNDSNKRIMYGKNGRKRVIQNYDWEKNVQTMIEILENN